MNAVDQMLKRYNLSNNEDATLALREVMQEIALAGLYRGGFFEKAAFYGGTCLRIFENLPRYSEDLDFSLLQSDANFSFEPYFQKLHQEFAAFGFEVALSEKKKTSDSDITSAFLKNTSRVYDLQVTGRKAIKIKFEVDTNPPCPWCWTMKACITTAPVPATSKPCSTARRCCPRKTRLYTVCCNTNSASTTTRRPWQRGCCANTTHSKVNTLRAINPEPRRRLAKPCWWWTKPLAT